MSWMRLSRVMLVMVRLMLVRARTLMVMRVSIFRGSPGSRGLAAGDHAEGGEQGEHDEERAAADGGVGDDGHEQVAAVVRPGEQFDAERGDGVAEAGDEQHRDELQDGVHGYCAPLVLLSHCCLRLAQRGALVGFVQLLVCGARSGVVRGSRLMIALFSRAFCSQSL